ncbi:DNA excision repair protein ERCC-6-like [Octopus bimaculoides]|uniref:DNA excision repair protein ERCC-6-like n=1 Tax=Octopus bimaculoides TaxID=37653 RepID=UPI00071DFE25|nr:DNA excision repair protein ERCC-6-like [Octopus bimaculoides]|eukprot:XP_014783663.1 PREDICTED: DNA excision repair protein ERCC-6-like [Octopus bimaculoides]
MDVPEDKLEQRRAIKMVTAADKYLQKHEYLNALNLYKESVDILPDPDIIYKIRKLRKYMKRKGYDLGENKENIDSCEPAANEIENSDENLIKKVKSPDILKEQSDFYCSSNSQNPPSNSHQMSAKSPLLDTDKQIVKKQNDKSPLTQSMEQLSLCSKQPVPVKAEDEVRVPLGDETNKASLADEVKRPPKKAVVEYDGPIRDFKDLRKYLYPHQKEGMKWLARLYSDGKGGILGDDMGLGKTLLMIGYLAKMFEVGEVETALVVVPSSLILPWHQEIDKWAPGLNYDSFHDKGKSGRKKTLQFIQRRGGVLLVTYGLLANNYEDLSTDRTGQEFVWDYMILDEGHKIKNPTKTQKAAHHIPSRNRIIMTGTPIQNNLVARQKDASLEEKQLGFMMTKNLQKLIAPFFLRRTKAELMSDSKSGIPKLPRKNDLIIWVKMTENQKQVYESYLCLDEVKQLMSSSKSPLVALIILKKLCDHLRLMSVRVCRSLGLLTKEESRKFRSSFHHLDDPDEIAEQTKEMNVLDQSSKHTSGSSTISSSEFNENACAATQLNGIPDTVLCQESGKLIVLIELLGYIVATNHKCVVFSQSAKMLDIIQKILNNLKYKYVRMDGKVIKLEERARIIRKFETDKSISIFLMTTQGFDKLIDPSWNPATDSQAVDRVYRIGQTKNVIIFRLMTCGSVEEKIYIRQLFKLSINRQTTKESKDPFRYFTKQDLKQLFIVENLAWSDTQQQLNEMFAGMRQSDEVVDQQIEYVFGVSDHDLVFSKEDDNEEATLSNSRVETMMVQAEEAIRSEVNTDRSVSVKQWSSTSSTVNNERQMRDPDGQNFVSLLPLNPNGKVPTVPTTHTRPPFNRNDDDVVVVVKDSDDDDDDDFTSVSIGSNNNNSSSSRTGVNDLTTPSIDRWTMNYNKNSSSSTLGTISNPISVEDCCSDEQLSPTPIVHSSVPNTKSLSDSVCESPAPENNTTKTGSIGRKSSILHSDDLLKSFMCNNSANSSRQRPRLSDSVRKAEDTAVDSEDGTWFVADSDDENGTTTEMGRHTTLKPSLNFCVAESDSENDMINDSCADGSLSGKALNSTKGSSSKNFRTPSFKGVSSVVPSSSPRTEGREEEEMETVADNSFEGQTEQRLGHDQSKNTECNGEGNDSVVNVKRHRKVYCVISSSEEDSGSDGVDDDDNNENKRTNDDSSSFDAVLPKLSKCHRKRLLSSSESEAGTDSDGEGENNISVVQEMLNISTNPHESLISSVQVRPVKVRRSQQFNNSQTTQSPSLSSAARKGPFEAELSDADMEGASAVVKNNSLVARGAGGTSDGVGEREEDGNGKREENDVKEDEDSEEEEEEEGDDEQEEENEMDVINKERKEISVVREENEDSEEEEIELPFLSNEKSEEFNNFVRDARKSYLSENYKEALYSTLKALNLDSSDLKLQTFALKLRKLCKPQ